MKLTRLAGSRSNSEKILVIFPGALGDFVCFLPAFEVLARGKAVDLFAREEYGDLLPASVKTRSLECYEISRLFVPGAEGDEKLKRFFASYAYVYSWMGSAQRDFVSQLELLCAGRLRVFPFRPPGSQLPMRDYFLLCVGQERPREVMMNIPIRSDALEWSQRFWQQSGLVGKQALLLSPGSGAREKNWPAEFYLAVAEWWERNNGKTVVVLGPVEEERGEIRNGWGRARVLRGLDLARLAAVISRCDLYLGNDSGVTHLAAALGAETVALFGPTDPVQWAAHGRRVTVITQEVECSPCLPEVMKSCPHRKCLTALSPGRVIRRLEEIVEMTNESGSLLDGSTHAPC